MAETVKKAKGKYHYGCGRRKTAVARVYLRPGTGEIAINETPFEKYFVTEEQRGAVLKPLEATGNRKKFDITIKVAGSGIMAQSVTCSHGIARALLTVDEKLRATLKPLGVLTRDSREKERKKPGKKRARRGKQFSKR